MTPPGPPDAEPADSPPAAPDDLAPEISTRVVSVFFVYFEHVLGRERMLKALRRVGGQPSLEFLLDTRNFVSLEYCVRVARVLTEESGDPQFLRKAGLYQLSSPRMLGFMFYVMRSLGSPQLYYRMAVKGAATFNRVCEMTIEELTDRRLRMRYRSLRPEGTRLLCEGRLGQLAAAPTLWGMPAADAREIVCQNDGAPACVYELHWIPGFRPGLRALLGGVVGAAIGLLALGAAGALAGAAVGGLAMLAAAYRADSRAKSRQLLDGAEASRKSLEELHKRFEEVRRLHAEAQDSHRSLREEARRRKDAEAALVEAQKLEAIGRLSGGIAHDFNNILTVIMTSVQYAKACDGSPAEVAASLDAISEASTRAAELTRRLLAFARRQIVEPRVLDLESHLRQLEGMLRPLVGEDVHLVFELAAERPQISIDPSQLEQVLMNLAVNARDAMPTGGTLRFATSIVTLAAGDPPLDEGLPPGEYVALTVSDTGCGMDEMTLRRAFEPFFTTKGPNQGTGLGLATCHGIVRQAGGAIALRSAPGGGTTVSIQLPRVRGLPQAIPAPAPQRPAGGAETILVVEDDPRVRQVVVRALGAAGYRVLEASNGEEALRLSTRETADIHLLVTDVVMEGLDGRALADRVRAAREGIRVLYISGYSSEVISRRGVLDEGIHLLRKPFSGDELLDKVRTRLDAPEMARLPSTGT